MDFVLTQKEFRERLKETPQKIVDLMSSEEAENVLETISKEYQIDPARTRRLAFYVAHVFLGVLPPKEFRQTIEKDLGFGSENALHIAEKISHTLFHKAKKELNDTYGLKTFTKEPIPHKPIPVNATNPLPPPPLDLRMQRGNREVPLSPQEEFPGEFINGTSESQTAPATSVPKPASERPIAKPEPPPRSTPSENDSYLESIEHEKPKPIQEGSVVNLKSD